MLHIHKNHAEYMNNELSMEIIAVHGREYSNRDLKLK